MTPFTSITTQKTGLPLPPRELEVDPLRELRELTDAIREDAQILPDEYLEEVRVSGGGE